jgi:nucleoside-diphosphate-sugar epimerase
VSNRRLREELGWQPRFPTFREGYAEAIAAVICSPGPTLQPPAML